MSLPRQGGTKLIILGSMGGPVVGGPRYQSSNVILCNGAAYVVDCGYGVTEQLVRAGVRLPSIKNIFVTHNHPDHNIEIGTLLYFTWLAGGTRALDIYGPAPLQQMVNDDLSALRYDINTWVEDVRQLPMPPIIVHEIASAGPVMSDDNVRVTSAVVDHPPVTPAFAYRFDAQDRSIVFSGDTAPSDAVVRLARNADILVHEAMFFGAAQRPLVGDETLSDTETGESFNRFSVDNRLLKDHLSRSHTSAAEAGRIAAEANVKTLVLSHLVPGTARIPDSMWRQEAARNFKGRIIVAQDLMQI
jgi:ribonuclease BN (tRNA processing enzyme)